MYHRFILIIHTLGFFAVLIPLVYLAPHGSAADVFINFIDPTTTSGYTSSGLAFLVALISTNLPFIGEKMCYFFLILMLILFIRI